MNGGTHILYVNEDGHVCGGRSVHTDERWRIEALPSAPLDPADIAWPDDGAHAWPHVAQGDDEALLPEPADVPWLRAWLGRRAA